MTRHERDVSQMGMAIGGLGAIAVAVMLVPLRTEIENANLALILVVVVVVAAIVGGRLAGAVAAVTATLAFDFFLTRPYLSMRIDSADDIETMVVLLTVGLLVGEVAARARRSRRRRDRAVEAIARVQRVASLVALDADPERVTDLVVAELTQLLELDECWLEVPPGLWVMPRLVRGGSAPRTSTPGTVTLRAVRVRHGATGLRSRTGGCPARADRQSHRRRVARATRGRGCARRPARQRARPRRPRGDPAPRRTRPPGGLTRCSRS